MIFPHAYIVSIFACCRQLYNKETMTGLPCEQLAKVSQGEKSKKFAIEIKKF